MALATKKKKIFDNRYEILSIVGRGSRSVVYQARNISGPGEEIALKILLNQSDASSNADNLRKEALAMVSSRHKYVIRLDDFHSLGELCYLAMEYAPKGDLRKYSADKGGTLPPVQVQRFLLQATEALAFIHKTGIVHRDIKPENILVMTDREIRIADFGVAVLPGEQSSIEELEKGVGTMSYMAPEVLDGTGYDQLSDQFSLGVTFYELLSGQHPFDSAPLAQQLEARNNIKPVSELVEDVPETLCKAISRAMSYDPKQRFNSLSDMRDAIQGKLVPQAEQAAPQATKPQAKQPEPAKVQPQTSQANPATQQPAKPAPDKKQHNAALAMIKEAMAEADNTDPVAATPKPEAKISKPEPQKVQAPTEEADASEAASKVAKQRIGAKPASSLAAQAMGAEPEPAAAAQEPKPQVGKQKYILTPKLPGKSKSKEEARNAKKPGLKPKENQQQRQNKKKAPKLKQKAARKSSNGKKKSIRDDGPIKRVLMTVAMITFLVFILPAVGRHINNLGKQYLNVDIAGTIMGTSSKTEYTSPIPRYLGHALDFPRLPQGMYSGIVRNTSLNTTFPISIISFAEQGYMVVILGEDGATPSAVPYPKESDSPLPALQVAMNGRILEFSGKNIDGEIVGYFKDLTTEEQGEWQIHPANGK